MNVLVLLGGPVPNENLIYSQVQGAQHIVAVDKGIEVALKYAIRPHVAVGDMDSVSMDALEQLKSMGVEMICAPAQKDETDAQLALDYAVQHGATSIVMLCGTGARLDHTMANLQLLVRMAKRGVKAVLLDDTHEIRAVTGHCSLNGSPGDTLSILPVEQGVMARDSQGLFYPLPHVVMPLDTPFAVSNRFVGQNASFNVVGGYAWVLHIKNVD